MNLDNIKEELASLPLSYLAAICTALAEELEARVFHDASARLRNAATAMYEIIAGRRGRCGP